MTAASPHASRGGEDIGFAIGIILVLCLFFLPVPALMIDFGLAFSIALSVLILMVGLWIQKPLEFSAFPTVLLVATVLRLALNISTTRLILAHARTPQDQAGGQNVRASRSTVATRGNAENSSGFWIHGPTIRIGADSAIENASLKSIISAGTGSRTGEGRE